MKASLEPIRHHGTLNERQQRFVLEYLVDLNATKAAMRAGYSARTAGSQGFDLLKKPEIQQALAQARHEQQERTHINADRVIAEAWAIFTADPRELVEVKVGCCRHCYGEGFKHQRTVAEFNHDRERWAEANKPPEEFDEKGGIGYDPLRAPNDECPECGGDGSARVVLKDTRTLSPAALALYAGAKEGKNGIEVQMHDKGAFAEKLFKHLGLYERHNRQKDDPLGLLLRKVSGDKAARMLEALQDLRAKRKGRGAA